MKRARIRGLLKSLLLLRWRLSRPILITRRTFHATSVLRRLCARRVFGRRTRTGSATRTTGRGTIGGRTICAARRTLNPRARTRRRDVVGRGGWTWLTNVGGRGLVVIVIVPDAQSDGGNDDEAADPGPNGTPDVVLAKIAFPARSWVFVCHKPLLQANLRENELLDRKVPK